MQHASDDPLPDLTHLITVKDVADKCGVRPATVYQWIDSGHLPAVRVGPRRIYVDADDVRRLIRPTHEHRPSVKAKKPVPARLLADYEREFAARHVTPTGLRRLVVSGEVDGYRGGSGYFIDFPSYRAYVERMDGEQ